MTTSALNPYIDYDDHDHDQDQMVIQYSDPFYPPSVYNQPAVPDHHQQQQQPGESKPRRRRKKNRGDDNESGSGIMMMMRKRKLSEEQVNLLELSFDHEHMLESDRKDRLASELGLDPRQVAVWFQNRRARWKSKKLEEEYCRLKSVHETTVLEKCRLEIEVLKLKQQLSESEKEIQILMESNSSSTTTVTTDQGSSYNFSMAQPFLGLQGMEDDFDWSNSFSFYQS